MDKYYKWACEDFIKQFPIADLSEIITEMSEEELLDLKDSLVAIDLKAIGKLFYSALLTQYSEHLADRVKEYEIDEEECRQVLARGEYND